MRVCSLVMALAGAVALLLPVGMTSTASAAPNRVVFSSIPSPLPANVPSEGPEAYAFSEIGDGIVFPASTGGTLTQVTVILSSWACQSGRWYNAAGTPGACVTTPGATFSQSITMNIYEASEDGTQADGSPVATVTQTFDIPYRPSSDTACPDHKAWYSTADGTCDHGIAVPITFDFSSQKVPLPSEVIVGVAFNTSHYGPSPLGEQSCYATDAGCPYDALNVSTYGAVYYPPAGTLVSSIFDLNGIFVNYTSAANSCSGSATPEVLADDTPCNTDWHPELEIKAHCGGSGLPCPSHIGE
jgi:hypothetical protein